MTLPAIQTVPTLEPWRKYQTTADAVTRVRQQPDHPAGTADPGSPTSVYSESGSEMDLAGVTALSRSIVREAALSALTSAISNSEPDSPHHRPMFQHEGALPRADSNTSLNAISPTHGRIDRKEELRARVQAKDEALRVMAQEVALLNEQQQQNPTDVFTMLNTVNELSDEVRKLADLGSPQGSRASLQLREELDAATNENKELRKALHEERAAREKAEQMAKIAEAKADAFKADAQTMKLLLDAMSK